VTRVMNALAWTYVAATLTSFITMPLEILTAGPSHRETRSA
jgi:hypothetical protein